MTLLSMSGCTSSPARVAEEALTAADDGGLAAMEPWLTPDSRALVRRLAPTVTVLEGEGEISCAGVEEETARGWHWVDCAQDGRTVRLALVDTSEGPLIDLFRLRFDLPGLGSEFFE